MVTGMGFRVLQELGRLGGLLSTATTALTIVAG